MIKNRIIYGDWNFEVSKSLGSFIWDKEGKKYLDFVSGWNVTNLGWNNPEINAVAAEQSKKNSYAAMWTPDPIQGTYAKELTDSLPSPLRVAIRATGGTEANEESFKIARAYTGRSKILGFSPTYHGQSLAELSVGWPRQDLSAMNPNLSDFVQIDFPSLFPYNQEPQQILKEFSEKLEKLLKNEDIAAVVTEAGIVTGWGLTMVAPSGFLKELRKITNKYGTMLILDEVGTGFSRCGKLFALEIEEVVPDIVTFAKGMSNGAAAIGAAVTTMKIAEKVQEHTMLISTFGWTPVSCAVSLKTLEIHKKLKIWEKAEKDGQYIRELLKNEIGGYLEDVRGFGMEIGISFKPRKDKDGSAIAKDFVKKAGENGLHTIIGSDNNIQIMPALTIDRDVLNKGLETLVDVVKSI